ncbi:MAG: type II secretion system protein N [Methylococcaceae bacterium]
MFKYKILQNQSLPKVALIPALAYLLYVANPIIQDFGSSKTRVIITADSEPLIQEKPENKQRDFLLIQDWHLFGQPPSDAAQLSAQNGTPQETQLQIKLLGVFFQPDQKNASYAIIEADDKSQKKYRPGDELPGGITLQSIAKEQVILLRNNQRESLSMGRNKTGLLFTNKQPSLQL